MDGLVINDEGEWVPAEQYGTDTDPFYNMVLLTTEEKMIQAD